MQRDLDGDEILGWQTELKSFRRKHDIQQPVIRRKRKKARERPFINIYSFSFHLNSPPLCRDMYVASSRSRHKKLVGCWLQIQCRNSIDHYETTPKAIKYFMGVASMSESDAGDITGGK